jgi:hypothetical protein
MIGNKVVNIAGPTINICSNKELSGHWEEDTYVEEEPTEYEGSINIVS